MNYLLDTCILSYYFRKEKGIIEQFQMKHPEDIKISSITFMEIEYGLYLNSNVEKKIRPIWKKLLEQIEVLLFNDDDAKMSAIIRGQLKQAGQLIGPYDILLAGTALSRHLIFVTANTKEFSRIKNLSLENWCGRY